ncbi:MAG: hypothetical protein DYG89_10740 [Caldilinea sp. CFX5]|nr:hypothetical protein [Caldilinea sp. CFX5]
MLQNEQVDPQLQSVLAALSPYQVAHPAAQIAVRRRHGVFLAIRIVDPAFYGVFWADREDEVWSLLQQLPDEIFANISLLLLLTPDEVATSGANIEFENPTPWSLKEAALHGRKVIGMQEQKSEDVQVQEIYNALAPYQAAHVNAQIDVRRRHEVSIH